MTPRVKEICGTINEVPSRGGVMAPRVKEICDYGRCRESVRGHVRGRVSGCECCGNVPAQGSLRIPPGRAAPAGGPSAIPPSSNYSN